MLDKPTNTRWYFYDIYLTQLPRCGNRTFLQPLTYQGPFSIPRISAWTNRLTLFLFLLPHFARHRNQRAPLHARPTTRSPHRVRVSFSSLSAICSLCYSFLSGLCSNSRRTSTGMEQCAKDNGFKSIQSVVDGPGTWCRHGRLGRRATCGEVCFFCTTPVGPF